MIEKDADTYVMLKAVAEAIDLASRNYNDEIIGIHYYARLSVLSDDELSELIALWHQKRVTCLKEKLASQWMVIQILMLIILAISIAWLSGGMAGMVASFVGIIAAIAMIEDKRVSIAKRNLQDAIKVCEHLQNEFSVRQSP
ncbi:hypothetical protein Q7C_2052 [Methylophaga frappieri]|uniref:Uncharacterized protein n=1 Tax=Methylophaga frappieri (strain ATCC BAA-2434 / DSM 25690 / JAM7) TaxID=754477 RepID=I1YJU8_METFJ|nr:hypothetical protein [Methylophaga frappieri]AFJ03191.1 hypothetical protein Q7C_2052 [Methylophaga frappieri]